MERRSGLQCQRLEDVLEVLIHVTISTFVFDLRYI